MDKLAAMQTFVEVVDQGSLTAAARSLGRSQTTVVRGLAQLESELGVRLIQRTTRRHALTGEGRTFLEACRRILADLDEAEAALTDAAAEPRGQLRVTAPVVFGSWHVAPLVAEFAKRYPNVQVDVVLSDGVVDLVEESVDVAVRIGSLADSSMIAVPVARMRRVVCASPGLLEEVGTPLRPADLETRPSIDFKPLTASGTWHFDAEGDDATVQPPAAFTCNQALVAAEACAQGLGFCLLLGYQAAPMVRSGDLEVVLADFEPTPRPVSLVYPGSRLVTARVRVFLEWMREQLRSRQVSV
ncbi:MAG: LysR family transcriptional regulator [Myxococcota bacterium]